MTWQLITGIYNMTPSTKEIGRQYEVFSLNRFKKFGRNTIHAAASLGVADGFAWDETGGIFLCNRVGKWPEQDRIEVLKKIKLFPNTSVVFYSKLPTGEKTYVYDYKEKNKL